MKTFEESRRQLSRILASHMVRIAEAVGIMRDDVDKGLLVEDAYRQWKRKALFKWMTPPIFDGQLLTSDLSPFRSQPDQGVPGDIWGNEVRRLETRLFRIPLSLSILYYEKHEESLMPVVKVSSTSVFEGFSQLENRCCSQSQNFGAYSSSDVQIHSCAVCSRALDLNGLCDYCFLRTFERTEADSGPGVGHGDLLGRDGGNPQGLHAPI